MRQGDFADVNANPTVSIVMPSRNHGPFIGQALASILGQTFADFELLVVDYGSTDATWDVLEAVTDPRVTACRFEEPGTGRALNFGFERARGRYLTWFQTDNTAYPDWLATLVDVLETEPATDFVYSDFEVMDAVGRTLEIVRWGPFDPDRLLSYCLVGPTFLYRRAVWETVGPYLPSHPRDDHDYWCRTWQAGFRLKNLPVNLGRNRLHANTRLRALNEEYTASVRNLIAANIRRAQARGVELFRVRDRAPADVAAVAEGYGRLRSRVRYALEFFLLEARGAVLAVLGQDLPSRLVLDILDEFGFACWLIDDAQAGTTRLGAPVLSLAQALARNFDFLFVCDFDPDDATRQDLEARGVPREKIVRLFLDAAQAPSETPLPPRGTP
jgi:glycosyltransferase involved in cell wall biosynthesis